MLKAVPVIPGDDAIFEASKEKEEDQRLEKVASHTISSEAMKSVSYNLTSVASRRAELEYGIDLATLHQGECEISEAKHSNACHRLG